jgi:Tol biopolymer transport system component
MAVVCLDGSVGLELGLPRDAWTPDLSPDGGRVAFLNPDLSAGVCHKCPNAPYLTVVDVGSTKGKFLIPAEGQPTLQGPTQFAWAPDGERIAYQAEHEGNVDIYVTELRPTDGYALEGLTMRLTTDPAVDELPTWTPDGSAILYANMGAARPDGSGYSPTQEIWSVPARGGTPTRLTDDQEPDTEPDVAADGRVAFWRSGEIWTMGIDGSGQSRLGIDIGFTPRWSPDGSKIALLRYDPSERTRDEPELPSPSLPLLAVVVVDLTSGEVTDIGVRVATDLNGVSWTPDGKGLLINRYDSTGS